VCDSGGRLRLLGARLNGEAAVGWQIGAGGDGHDRERIESNSNGGGIGTAETDWTNGGRRREKETKDTGEN